MDKQVNRIWRWALPDDWEPVGTWCVQVTIPAGEQYVEALAGALGLLSVQKSWARDDTRTGARIVAKTWRDALYINPLAVSENCYTFPTPPAPTQPDADDAAAAIFTVIFQHWVRYLNLHAPTPAGCANAVDDLFAELAPYNATQAVHGALSQLCDALNGDAEARASFETDCPYMDEFAYLRDKIAANPYDWLNHLNDWLFDWLDHTADYILRALNITAGLLGGAGLGGFIDDLGGIPDGGGAGFGADDSCEWVATLDFRESNWGFQLVDLGEGRTLGIWQPGVGWQTSTAPDHPGGEFESTGLQVSLEHPDFELNRVVAVYTLHYGDDQNCQGNSRIFYVYEETLQPYMATTLEGDELTYDPGPTDWTVGESPMTIRVYTECGMPLFSETGYACLHSITFYGRGLNPWLNPPG
jgi:hypothetical protein